AGRGTGDRAGGVGGEGRGGGGGARGPGAGSTGVQATGGKLGVQSQGGEVGVEGQGRVGVKGFGNTGVEATGTKIGVVAKGPVGVQGTGSPGGRFVSGDRHAQLHLEPHPLEPGSRVPVTPTELEPAGNQLPKTGQLGDLWLTQHDGGPPRCSLWLSVGASGGNAMWAQVLLGTPITG